MGKMFRVEKLGELTPVGGYGQPSLCWYYFIDFSSVITLLLSNKRIVNGVEAPQGAPDSPME
jgi:hypothetical protein